MIEYVSEAEYERRFKQWTRGRKAKVEDVESRLGLQVRIQAYNLAKVYKNAPREVSGLLKNWNSSCEWDSLRAEFGRAFVVAPTGRDGNAIAFSGNWKDKS